MSFPEVNIESDGKDFSDENSSSVLNDLEIPYIALIIIILDIDNRRS